MSARPARHVCKRRWKTHIAAKLGLDSYDVFLRNLVNVPKERAAVYEEEMKIAAKLMDWKTKWHPHGRGSANGSVVTGLGMAIRTPGRHRRTIELHW